MSRGKIVYTIEDAEEIGKGVRKCVSFYSAKGYIIMARYGVNKNTLKKLLLAWIKKEIKDREVRE